jgi:peptidyl-prolyl cis-trans isomerase A (cyclophilin A)
MKRIILLMSFPMIAIAGIVKGQHSDTLKTKSGIRYIVLKRGNGAKPWPGSKVGIYYTVMLLSGKKIDTNVDTKPYRFKLGDPQEVIKGLNEGVSLMRIGDKMRFIIPPELAFGKKGVPNPEGSPKYLVDPNAYIIYEVEVVDYKL